MSDITLIINISLLIIGVILISASYRVILFIIRYKKAGKPDLNRELMNKFLNGNRHK